MSWKVQFHDEFQEEFDAFDQEVKEVLLAEAKWVQNFGPQAKRPRVDTLKGSKNANMKELRFEAAGGVWRIAFAFDPKREAILLVGGDKSGISEKKFYDALIAKADARYAKHEAALKAEESAAKAAVVKKVTKKGKKR